MAFKYTFQPNVEKEVDALDSLVAKRILKKLQWFLQQKNPLDFAIVLRQPATGNIRFRVGDYRVIAVVDREEKYISIIQIAHRRDVYR